MTAPPGMGRGRRTVTVIGGGVHVVGLLEALARAADLPDLDIRLVARREDRLGVIGRHAALVLRAWRPGWTLRWTTDLADGVRGSDVVVPLVRIGGSAARDHDERFPTVFGLVGDEGIGPGGMANAWRTLPPLRSMAEVITSLAPGALVANLMAPLGVTTRALTDAGLHCIGVCELPIVVRDRLLAHVPADRIEDTRAALGFGGLNHLSWYWPTTSEAVPTVRSAALAAGLVDAATWDRFGGVPMPYYFRVLEPARGEALGIRQPAGRAVELASQSERALERMRLHPGSPVPELAQRPTPWFDRALVPVMAGWWGVRPYEGPLNLMDHGHLAGVPDGSVAEVRAEAHDGRVGVPAPDDPPGVIVDFLGRWSTVEGLLHRATVDRNPSGIAAAVDALPVDLGPEERRLLARSVMADVGVAA